MCPPGSSVGAQGPFTGKHGIPSYARLQAQKLCKALLWVRINFSLQRAPTVSELFWFHEMGLREFSVERRDREPAIVAQTALLFRCARRG